MENGRHELEVEVKAPVQAVWAALTEPEELVKWFTPEARVEPGWGGKIWLKWGEGMEGDHEILEWEPGKRLEIGWAGRTTAFEIEEREGGATLRIVPGGFPPETREEEIAATFGGWSTYLAVLRYVLENKQGEKVTNATMMRMVPQKRDVLWPRLTDVGKVVGMPAEEIARPATGYVVGIAPALDNSPVAVFCEGFGETTCVTVGLYLFGMGRAQAKPLRERISLLLEGLG